MVHNSIIEYQGVFLGYKTLQGQVQAWSKNASSPLGIIYYVNFLGRLGSNEFLLKWRFGFDSVSKVWKDFDNFIHFSLKSW